MNPNNSSATTLSPENYQYQQEEINLVYAIFEVLVAIVAVTGNALVIYVFRKERRLRRRTNYYIVSLAVADLLVGLLGIPFAIMSSIGFPPDFYACLFTVSLLLVLCTISIFCLVAVSVDRYWAILHPMGYSRNVRTKTAIVIISICWVAGCLIGFLPLMGWHKDGSSFDGRCFFLYVMDYNYLVFLYFGTIITPAFLLAAFYAHIYQVVLKQMKRIVTMNPDSGSFTTSSSGGTMLRMLGAAQKREVKAAQNLSIIVLFFMICWIPLYTINCVLAFCRDCEINPNIMLSCIILSHANSAGNPVLYAYHLRDFRAALKRFFCNLFGIADKNPQTNRTSLMISNNNCNNWKKNGSSVVRYRRKSIAKHVGPTIVKNSAALAVATSVECDKDAWNIPDLSDSESSANDRVSIVRPGTPYTPHRTTEINGINRGFDSIVDDLSFENHNDSNDLESIVAERSKRPRIVQSSPSKDSSSSNAKEPLFFVETRNIPKFVRSCSFPDSDDNYRRKVKMMYKVPFKTLKSKKPLRRSLSDDATNSSDSLRDSPIS